jgi:3-methyl-2-oxobutanoate hydroxymethyltransferase
MRFLSVSRALHLQKLASRFVLNQHDPCTRLWSYRAFSKSLCTQSTHSTSSSEDDEHGRTKKFTVPHMRKKYEEHIPITMVTATDFHSGSMLDKAGIDMILVGDSLAMTSLGHPDTTRVTMDEMIHHAKSVAKAVRRGFLVGDLPFGSYEINNDLAVSNAFRFIKEAGMNAVKLEGGEKVADRVRAITQTGIPVVGHIGLTPQSVHALGGYKPFGKTKDEALQLLKDAKALQDAGCICIVIECVPEKVAQEISQRLTIPTIGIGSGVHVDGQVLVFHDVLGMYDRFTPKFCRQYAQINQVMQRAIAKYRDDVVTRQFPSKEYIFKVKRDELNAFMAELPPVDELKRLERDVANTPKPNGPEIIPFGENKNILIVGAGALGSLIGGKITAMNKHNLLLWDPWEEQVQTVKSKGFSILNHNDSTPQRVVEVNITSNINDIKPETFDIAIVLTKGFNQEAADVVNTALSPNGVVLTLQNGLGNKEMIQGLLTRPYRILRGIVYIGATLMKPGIVRQNSKRDREIIVDNAPYYGKVLTELLNGAGFQAFASDDIHSQIWEKLIVNCAINPLTALFGLKNGEIVENPKMRSLVMKVVEECVRVARTDGRIRLESYDPAQVTQRIVSVAQATYQNTSSMLADMNRLRDKREKGTTKREIKTEISRINGAIVDAAAKYDISVPYNAMLVEMVEALEEHLNQPKKEV